MIDLKDIKLSTDVIFNNHMDVPVPPVIWKDRLEALSEAGFENHRTSCLFDMRCWQAEEMGFKRIESGEMVKMLTGEHATSFIDGDVRHIHEYVYNHHTDSVFDSEDKWGGFPTIFIRKEKKGKWYWPPFGEVETWRVQMGKFNYLKRDIPYGVVLKINEVKKFKLFNVFSVMAPMEAWERKTDIDPIAIASIWELPFKEPYKEKKSSSAGQTAHFFLAQW